MKITHCKLKKKVQKELLRFFVLQVTACSAADILGIRPNSAALFYRKIRMVITVSTIPRNLLTAGTTLTALIENPSRCS